MSILTLNTGNDGTLDYEDFLKDKVAFDRRFGFEVDDADLSEILLPHQRAIVKWAVRTAQSRRFARYELYEDLAFRTGWVEHRDGNGKTDCNSWPEFLGELQRSTGKEAVL